MKQIAVFGCNDCASGPCVYAIGPAKLFDDEVPTRCPLGDTAIWIRMSDDDIDIIEMENTMRGVKRVTKGAR